MDQEDFGKLIKKIRKENKLTQKDLASKYNVTYQAVSKWENGKNMPDISLIKMICKDFDMSLDEVFNNKKTKTRKLIHYIAMISVILTLIVLAIILYFSKNDSYKFKTISSTCNDFNITGSMSYNTNKSTIYISNVSYCGGDDTEIYKSIECSLIEKDNNVEHEISTCDITTKTTLEDFLKDLTFSVDNHDNQCKEYRENNLYLEIIATKNDNRSIMYKIPLSLNEICSD